MPYASKEELMLSQFDNETLTRVGPGTTMGDLLREYWIPAMLSTELPGPDSDPVRLRLLGEDLIAFRDTNGELRPHRQLLPAPSREPLLRSERGVRHPLRVPRLEVRR